MADKVLWQRQQRQHRHRDTMVSPATEHDRYEAMPEGMPPRPALPSRVRSFRHVGSFLQPSTGSVGSDLSHTRSLNSCHSSNPGSAVSASAKSLNVSNMWVAPPHTSSIPTLQGEGIFSDGSSDDEDPHERVHKATTVSAFVTFLKALFGVSLLFQPRILGETGLILGSLIHVIIMCCCAFACYLLLMARYMAVAAKERRELQQAAEEEEKKGKGVDALAPDAPDGIDACIKKKAKPKGEVFGVRDRLITYGDLARQLMGRKLAAVITCTIFVLHILFAAGMVAGATRNLMVFLGWQSDEEEEGGPGEEAAANSNDVLGGAGQLALTALIFPVVLKLLLIRDLSGMFMVSAVGLIVYFVGCVGSMAYSAATFSEWDGGPDAPQDIWEWKWGGIPAFVASTVYAIEGINLALPTANNINDQRRTVPVVSGAVLMYGLLTLGVAWVGYIGGLGGGPGTRHGENGCHYISYCLSSNFLSRIHELSLSVAMLLTLPVILYPSTELMEVWAEEREKEGRYGRRSSCLGGFSAHLDNYSNRTKLFLRDQINDVCSSCETREYLDGYCVCTVCGDLVCGDLNQVDDETEDDDMTLGIVSDDRKENPDTSLVETTCVHMAAMPKKAPTEEERDTDQHPANTMGRHFKLRLGLALVVCTIGATERRYYAFITFTRGVGFSFIGFCLPPVLYLCAARQEGRTNPFMLLLLVGLILFGVFTMVLAFIPSFTDQEYMRTEPP